MPLKHKMKLEEVLNRIEGLIKKGEELYSTRHTVSSGTFVNTPEFTGIKAASLSFVLKLYPITHPYYTEINKLLTFTSAETLSQLLNILRNIHEEISGGWLFTIKGLISSEIFADFMEMSKNLLDQSYKDAAAVMIGGVLEEHLRQLCSKNDIPIETENSDKIRPRNADSLNSDLNKREVYNTLDSKSVVSWLGLRNDAAHGHYGAYTKGQVDNMYNGVMEFLKRNSI